MNAAVGTEQVQPPPGGARVAIDARGITKIFGAGAEAVRALDDVSVGIRENEFFTLLGPSGCGKTTLLRLIAGFDHQTRGRILLYDDDISALPPFRRPVNTVFQNYALFPHMSVGQNIGFGLKMLGKPAAEVMKRWFTREEIADGTPLLPTPASISYRLIESWFDAGSLAPLATQARAGRWNQAEHR